MSVIVFEADGAECKSTCTLEKAKICIGVVRKGRTVVGHLPRRLSRLCALFIRRGGSIHCSPTGKRRYSADLPQGGLEIPCILYFKGDAKEIKKVVKLCTVTKKKPESRKL